jgi:hypothetical protein
MSLIGRPISQPSKDISPVWTPVITAGGEIYSCFQCRFSGKTCVFYVGTIQRIYLSSENFYSDSTLVLGLIHVDILMFCLKSRRWFIFVFSFYILACVASGIRR